MDLMPSRCTDKFHRRCSLLTFRLSCSFFGPFEIIVVIIKVAFVYMYPLLVIYIAVVVAENLA